MTGSLYMLYNTSTSFTLYNTLFGTSVHAPYVDNGLIFTRVGDIFGYCFRGL